MNEVIDPDRPIVLCPLEFERQALTSAGLEDHCTLLCTGPGRDNIVAWAREHTSIHSPIILAGLAGSLTTDLPVGGAHVVTVVIEEQGQSQWEPTIRLGDADDREIILTSTQAPLTGRLPRQLLNRDTGSVLIDLESTAFAGMARKYGWAKWGIVRGISDDLSTLLPENIDQWVDETGRTRWGMVMRSLLAKPSLIPRVVELRQNSVTAMQGVAELLLSIFDQSD